MTRPFPNPPTAPRSLLELMEEAQAADMPLMKWAMVDSSWVRRPFIPRVVGGNRSDAQMQTEDAK